MVKDEYRIFIDIQLQIVFFFILRLDKVWWIVNLPFFDNVF